MFQPLDEPIITNKLDEQQQRYIEENERDRRLSQTIATAEAHSDYRFKPLSVDELLRKFAGQTLPTWITGARLRRLTTLPNEMLSERDT